MTKPTIAIALDDNIRIETPAGAGAVTFSGEYLAELWAREHSRLLDAEVDGKCRACGQLLTPLEISPDDLQHVRMFYPGFEAMSREQLLSALDDEISDIQLVKEIAPEVFERIAGNKVDEQAIQSAEAASETEAV